MSRPCAGSRTGHDAHKEQPAASSQHLQHCLHTCTPKCQQLQMLRASPALAGPPPSELAHSMPHTIATALSRAPRTLQAPRVHLHHVDPMPTLRARAPVRICAFGRQDQGAQGQGQVRVRCRVAWRHMQNARLQSPRIPQGALPSNQQPLGRAGIALAAPAGVSAPRLLSGRRPLVPQPLLRDRAARADASARARWRLQEVAHCGLPPPCVRGNAVDVGQGHPLSRGGPRGLLRQDATPA